MGVTLRHFLVLGLLAFVVTYLCVPLARRLALRLDAVDYPSARRVNKKPTPRMGGVAMAAGIAAALIVEVAGEYFFGWAGFYIHGTDRAINHAGVMCGLLTIVCVGAMDDVYSLKPSVKFAGQILGATIIAASGLLLSSIANPLGAGFIQFGWWSYPLTVLYLVCFMNVINLIDGLDGLAAIPWTSTQYAFWSMLIAFCFCSIGGNLLVYMAAMKKIPDDLFEAAFVDGATEGKIFFRITLPLIADNVKTQFTFWTIGCIGFFLWSRVFSVVPSDPTTITPASYMYDQIFGTSISSNAVASGTNVGMGAAIGVVLCLITVAAMALINLIFPKEKYEM